MSLCWGLVWPLAKLALEDVPVLAFRAWGLLVAGPLFLAWAALRGERLTMPLRELPAFLLSTFFNITLWYVFSAVGLTLMPAGRASVIAYTMPAWAVLFGMLFLGERPTPARLGGLALGMAGLAALLLPERERLVAAPLGVLMMIGAAATWGIGTVVMKRFQWTLGVVALTGWQLVLGGAPIILAAIVIGPFPGLERAGLRALLAFLYVVFAGMIFAQWAWYKVLAQLPASVAALGTLAIPAIGLVASALVLHEPLTLDEIVAVALVIAALALVMRRPAG
jgi:drug/metabolite transporter (DMT)-like permease